MPQTVYIETTVISYLTAWNSRDLIRAAHQHETREWWDHARGRFQLVTSELVEREASAGDPAAAAERLKVIVGIEMLAITPAAESLTQQLIHKLKFPPRAQADALHVAIAATNGINYLL